MSQITTLIFLSQRHLFPLQHRLSRAAFGVEKYFSTKSDGTDDGNSKENDNLNKKETQRSVEDAKEKPTKQALSKDETKEAAKKKLFSLLTEMKIVPDSETNAGKNLRLARPVKRISKQERFKEEIERRIELKKSPEEKLQDAAKVVASSVKGDTQQTLAELNEKLRKLNLASQTQTSPEAESEKILDEETSKNFMSSVEGIAATVADGSAPKSKLAERLMKMSAESESSGLKRPIDELVKGMKIERQVPEDRREFEPRETRREYEPREFQRRDYEPRGARRREYEPRETQRREYEPREFQRRDNEPRDARRREYEPRETHRREYEPREFQRRDYEPRDARRREYEPREIQRKEPRPPMTPRERINIFDAAPLNIFNVSEEPIKETKKTVWQTLEEKNLKLLTQFAPANGFEEMIMWTEQGKHWTFPIDNQRELAGEENVGFHEHVFLEQHLHGFPTKGPIRHFMELVVVGLSKNPYVSVERKIENIDWFRNYFKEKEDILKASGALG